MTERDAFDHNCRWILHLGLLLIVAAVTIATLYFGPTMAGFR